MLFFNVIRYLISNNCYYYFTKDHEIFYEGFELPENANDFLVLEIEGGESEHGPYLAFEVI